MIESGIVALLMATPAVTALIGTRLFPVNIPSDADVASVGACVTFKDVTGSPEFTVDQKKWVTKRIQFDAFSAPSNAQPGGGYGAAKAALEAIAGVLDTYSGDLPGGTRVIFSYQSLEIDNFEHDSRVYRCMCEYEITYTT